MIEKAGAYTMEDSPYIQSILTKLRDKNTDTVAFRRNLVALGRYMAYELTKTFDVEHPTIATPLEETTGTKVKMSDVTVIVVLRAAIPFMEGVIKVFEDAKAGVVSASRGAPPKFDIEMNYVRIPPLDNDILIILDPMIATGSTLVRVLDECNKYGEPARRIIMGIIAAPEGIRKIKEKYGNVEIYVAAVDRELNGDGYILPGLGDAGDRAFKTGFD
uniref:Uracil phosphoribosyltransferase n=1 Tax=uncultured euryarchaeote Alv-FOS1 TaxID=337892 RepID=Q3SAA7_9EURY|nr:uracil phosphoribosyltransferase [uncultured euryarchaeote Alv-FOS1]